MPTPEQLLRGLGEIAGSALLVSISWHLALTAALIAWFAGLRPSRRLVAAALSLPLVSVALLAFGFGNPFNAAVFSSLAFVLAILAWRAPAGAVEPGPRWARAIGCALLGFGWVYPHFLEQAGWTTYLYAAPLGTIPCPTLSVVIGAALVTGGCGARAWSTTLGVAGAAYALFGTLRLGVTIDVVLLVGAVALLGLRRSISSRASSHRDDTGRRSHFRIGAHAPKPSGSAE